MSGNEQQTAKEQAPAKTLEELKKRFQTKIDKMRQEEFNKKAESKYKELADAEALVRNKSRELEDMFAEFQDL